MHLLLYVWVVQAGSCEVLYIFMLCFPNVAVVKECKMNHFYGLAIGHDIVARTYGAGSVSGGCVNFAVATGIDVSNIRLGSAQASMTSMMEQLAMIITDSV